MGHPRQYRFGFLVLPLAAAFVGSLGANTQSASPTYDLALLTSTAASTGGFADAQINSAGEIAFTSWSSPSTTAVWAGNATGVQAIVTSGVPTPGIVEELADVGNGHVAINDAGTIAFVGVQATGTHALYVSTRQGWRKALERFDAALNDPSLNNAGDVAFHMAAGSEEGIYLLRRETVMPIVLVPGDGQSHTFEGLGNENELNARDQVVYRAGPPESIVLVERGQHQLVALDGGLFSLNNAGSVAIAGGGGVAVVSLTRGTTRQITSTPAFSVSLADTGDVAYSDGQTLSIARGGNGAIVTVESSVVARTGDTVDGSQIANIDLYRRALNSVGEIVFMATLSDGRNAVMLARPTHR